MKFTTDELRTVKSLVAKSGLIKAFDGSNWIDLRIAMQNVVDDALELHTLLNDSMARLKALQESFDEEDDLSS